MPCRLENAEYMWVRVRDEEEILVANRYGIITAFQRARDLVFGKRAPGHVATVPVHHLEDGTPYFCHEGSRYVNTHTHS